MGERGLPARLLAPRYGAHLTFGALAAGRESAPGAPLTQSCDVSGVDTMPLKVLLATGDGSLKDIALHVMHRRELFYRRNRSEFKS